MPSPFARTQEPAGQAGERKVLEAKGEQDREGDGGWEMEACAPCRRWLATKLQQEMGAFLQALLNLRAPAIPVWEAKVDVPRPRVTATHPPRAGCPRVHWVMARRQALW